ncbi:hypothetical protein UFOVP630_5 [uncultured Caudovirales phage]|uniref:Uncharacterized protein n=1 Tax=uncultured Caudovirales phage TaxID=2100421 RepID=A0A6J5NAK0_9CAUD|nr:hypothetical protein UFOVP630_5 [uncultured Caudovirales phage]
MASKQEIQLKIDAAVDSADAAKSLGQLKKSLLEIQELQSQIGDTSSAEFAKLSEASAKASEKLASTRDAIGDIGDRARTMEGTAVERLTGSFGLLKESIMNLDFDKAKIGAEGLLNTFTPVVDGKLVTGLAGVKGAFGMLGDGVKSLGQTFMTVGKALLTNPIFLLAAAIIAIVAVVILIMDKLGILKKIMDALGWAIGLVVKAFEALTDWLGLTTNAQEDAAESAKKLGEEQRAQIDKTAKAQQDLLKLTEGMTADEIKMMEKKLGVRIKTNESSFDIEKRRLEATNRTLKTEIDALNAITEAGGELTEEQQKDLEQRKKDYEANSAAIVSQEQQKQKAILDINKKSSETLQAWKLKNITDDNKRAKEQLKLDEADALRKIDVEIINAKRLGQSTKDLEASKNEIKKYYTAQSTKIDETVQKQEADKAKANYDNYKSNIGKQLKALEDAEKAKVSKTDEGTAARVQAEIHALDAVEAFQKKNAKALGLSQNQLTIIYQENIDKRKKLQDDFDNSVLDAANKLRVTTAENKVLEAQDDFARFEAQKELLRAQADVELSDKAKTAEEKKKIEAQLAIDTKAIDDEITAKKQENKQKELDNAVVVSDTKLSKAQFELETEQLTTDAKIAKLNEVKDLEIQALNDQMNAELANTELTAAQKEQIEENYRQQRETAETATTEKIKALKQAELQATVDTAQKGMAAGQALADAVFAIKKRNLVKGSAEEMAAAKKQFQVNKAMQLGMAVIDGFKAITTSLAQSPIAIGPIPNPAGIASLAFAAITTAANIAKIAASKFEGGGTPTAPTPPGMGGGGAGGAEGSAATNFQPAQFFGLGQGQMTPGGPNGGMQRVYVTETDISSTQNKVKVIEDRATIR